MIVSLSMDFVASSHQLVDVCLFFKSLLFCKNVVIEFNVSLGLGHFSATALRALLEKSALVQENNQGAEDTNTYHDVHIAFIAITEWEFGWFCVIGFPLGRIAIVIRRIEFIKECIVSQWIKIHIILLNIFQ